MSFLELLGRKTEVPSHQLQQLARHYELLQKWNEVINLTRIERIEHAVEHHYLESIAVGRALPVGPLSIADIGSGAGFPGIPLAIVRPDCQVVLVESHKRKAVFLTEAARSLPNVRIIAERAEGLDRHFDWLVSRAVAPAEVLNLPATSNYAILMSEADLHGLPMPVSVTKYPWGNKRVLAMFHVEHDRIDQTSRAK